MRSFNIAKPAQPHEEGPFCRKKAGVKNMPSTKIEFNCNKIARVQGMDELADLLFPGNKSHQRVFLAILIELKYAPAQFMPHLSSLCER
jgi:hypothetical protein